MDLLQLRLPRFKLIEEPLLPILGRHVDAANFMVMFLLLAISIVIALRFKGKVRQYARRAIQLLSMIMFFFIFAQMWCGYRNEIVGILKIGIDNYWAFAFIYLWLIIICFSLIFGRFFCGWVCPVGFIQELLGKRIFGKVISKIPELGKKSFKIILNSLFVFILLLFAKKTSPTNFFLVEDASLLFTLALFIINFFVILKPSTDKKLRAFKYPVAIITILLALVGMRVTGPACSIYMNELDYSSTIATVGIFFASFIVFQSYCRYMCPFGAFFKVTSRLPFITTFKDPQKCTSCSRCFKVCQVDAVREKDIDNSECFKCGTCADVCKSGAIEFKICNKRGA